MEDELSLPKGNIDDVHPSYMNLHHDIDYQRPCTATLQKMMKEMVPGDVRFAGETVDMVVAACTGARITSSPCKNLSMVNSEFSL